MNQLIDVVSQITSKVLAESLERAQIALADHGDKETGALSVEDHEAYWNLGELKDAISEDDLGKCWMDTPSESCEAPAIRTLNGMSFCAKHFSMMLREEEIEQRKTKQQIKREAMSIIQQLSAMGEA